MLKLGSINLRLLLFLLMLRSDVYCFFFFFQAEDGIRDHCVTGVQTCALPISSSAAIDLLKQSVAAEDALNYSEPPPWYPPVRPILGRVLLEDKDFAEAEKVFRADLEKHPRNARALAGLRDCLNAQGRKYEADQIDQQFRAAWKVAAVTNAAASKP